jgi:hypothetical protein
MDPAGPQGSGGAGGIIILASKRGTDYYGGTLSVNGGSGGDGNSSGNEPSGGGGGIIHLLVPSGQITSGTATEILRERWRDQQCQGFASGGGAMGGNGGHQNRCDLTAASGAAGHVFITTVVDPVTLFMPYAMNASS